MKLKKALSICIMFVIMVTLTVPAKVFAATSVMRTAPELAAHVYKGYNGGTLGPISIVPVTLGKDGTSSIQAYLVSLSGTEFVTNQSTGIWTDLKSGFELNSPYLSAVISAINNNIPKNSNLIIAGHSLGGMIAQQVSGNNAVKDYYNILNVITFGAPLVNPFGREGTIRRLGDTADPVPYLSASGTFLLPWQVMGLNKEDGGYTDGLQAHKESYLRTDVWGTYDVLGIKYGKSYLQFDSSAIKFYKAPVY